MAEFLSGLRVELVNVASTIGKLSASMIKEEYRTATPTEIATKMSVRLIHVSGDNVRDGLKLRSEYFANPPSIMLCENSLSELTTLAKSNGFDAE